MTSDINAVITPAMHVLAAKSFIENLDDEDNPIYGFAGRAQDWETLDNKAPTVSNSLAAQTEAIHDIIFAKKITSKDAHLAFLRQDWESGQIYTVWSMQNNKLYKTSVKQGQKPCYVTIFDETYNIDVFMCIFNNYDGYSTVAPNSVDGYKSYEIIKTSDGYIWKWLFNVPRKFLEAWDYNRYCAIPQTDKEKSEDYKIVEEKLKDLPPLGDILQINILNGGKIKSYVGPTSGVSAIWKIEITGNGQDAEFAVDAFETLSTGEERVVIGQIINSNGVEEDVTEVRQYWIYTIKSIVPINFGTGYTHAKAELVLLDENTTFVKENNNPVYCNFDVLLNPERLLGKNIENDICARFITTKVKFTDDEIGIIHNDITNEDQTIPFFPTSLKYRQVGLVKGLKTLSGNLIKDDKIHFYTVMNLSSVSAPFQTGATITGTESRASAYILHGHTERQSVDTQTILINNITGEFYLTDQNEYGANEQVEHSINVNGVSEVKSMANITSYIKNNNDNTQGTILFLNNFDAIARAEGKSETFFLTFEL